MSQSVNNPTASGKESTPEVASEQVFTIPMSFAQQRLWFLDQLQPNSATYNVPIAVRTSGALSVEALEQSLDEIVQRHEVLRATFDMVEEQPVQLIVPRLQVELARVDLRTLPQSEREAEARRLASEEAKRPFDLRQGPVLRASLLRLGSEDHVLLLTLHHIVFDQWSRGILLHELTTLYAAFSAGQPSPLPALPIQYADYAVWQRQYLQGGVLEKQLSYWKKQLVGAPANLELPTDRPHPAVRTFLGARASLALSKALAEKLRELSRQESATLFMTLLAAFQTLLARYTEQDDIVVGSPIANRTRSELEPLIGFFVNTLTLRTNLSGNPSFRELLRRVKEVALGAYVHQDLPFEKLVEELQPERRLTHNPLTEVSFVLRNAPRSDLELSGLRLKHFEASSDTAKFDLAVFVTELSEGLACSAEYSTDVFEAATIARMLRHFQVLLEGIVADPGKRIWELPLLTPAEKDQLLVEWNSTETDYPRDRCVHQLFEAQVERTPEAVAVVYGQKRLSYGELNRRANQLAHYLRKRGIRAEALVGVSVERSLEMVVGLLGILKAGGAYVPLDPAYPEERLAFMLQDCQVSILLTQKSLALGLPRHQMQVLYLDGGSLEGGEDLGQGQTQSLRGSSEDLGWKQNPGSLRGSSVNRENL